MKSDATVRLHTGRAMPVLGLGTWLLKDDTAGSVEEALRLGYRMIDTSGDYGTQPGVGEALRRTDVPRDEIYLVTKVEEDEDAYEATRRNLDELGQEFVDLMLIHRPPPFGAGVELWQGLIRARDEGLARDIGVSNYSIEQMEELIGATGETPAVNQIEWSPVRVEHRHARLEHSARRRHPGVQPADQDAAPRRRAAGERGGAPRPDAGAGAPALEPAARYGPAAEGEPT